jgi:endo-1,4-beta-D-glucanase Y
MKGFLLKITLTCFLTGSFVGNVMSQSDPAPVNYVNTLAEYGYTQAQIDAKIQDVKSNFLNNIYIDNGSDAYILGWDNRVYGKDLGFGMMYCVQMNMQAEFNKLWKFAHDHLLRTSGEWEGYFAHKCEINGTIVNHHHWVIAEAYIATSLYFADRLWGSTTGIYNYKQEADDFLTFWKNDAAHDKSVESYMFNDQNYLAVHLDKTDEVMNPAHNVTPFYELWSYWAPTQETRNFYSTVANATRTFFSNQAVNSSTGLFPFLIKTNGSPTSFHHNRYHQESKYGQFHWTVDHIWFGETSTYVRDANNMLELWHGQGLENWGWEYDLDGTNLNPTGEAGSDLVAMTTTLLQVSTSASNILQDYMTKFWDNPLHSEEAYLGKVYGLGLLQLAGKFKIITGNESGGNVPPTAIPGEDQVVLTPVTSTTLNGSGSDDGEIVSYEWSQTSGPNSANIVSPNSASTEVNGLILGEYIFELTVTDDSAATGSNSMKVTVMEATGAYKIPTPITVDGNLTESEWNLMFELNNTILGSSDNTVTFGVLWDDTYLYVGAQILDANLYSGSGMTHQQDGLEVYLDAGNEKALTYDGNDWQIVKLYNTGTDKPIVASDGDIAGLTGATVNISGGYTVEIAIPWTDAGLSSAPDVGYQIGFDVGNNDSDNDGSRDGQLMWFHETTNTNYKDPSGFGNMTLLDLLSNVGSVELAENNINIHPNPVVNDVTITGKDIVSVTITGINGNILMAKNINKANEVSLSLDGLNAGIYFATIATEDGATQVKKIIKAN